MLIILYSQKRKRKIGFLTSGATSFLNPGQDMWVWSWSGIVVIVTVAGLEPADSPCSGCGWPAMMSSKKFTSFIQFSSLRVCWITWGGIFLPKTQRKQHLFLQTWCLRPGNSLPTLSSFWGSWDHLSHDVCNIQHQHLLDTYCIPGYGDP